MEDLEKKPRKKRAKKVDTQAYDEYVPLTYLQYEFMENHEQLYLASIEISNELPLTKAGDIVSLKMINTQNSTCTLESFDHLSYDFD